MLLDISYTELGSTIPSMVFVGLRDHGLLGPQNPRVLRAFGHGVIAPWPAETLLASLFVQECPESPTPYFLASR